MTRRLAVLPRVHVYDTLRTAHLERAAGNTAATYLYQHRGYDWDDTAAGAVTRTGSAPGRCSASCCGGRSASWR